MSTLVTPLSLSTHESAICASVWAPGGSQLVQRRDLCQPLRRKGALLQKNTAFFDAAVCGHAVQIFVRQQSLRQRAESDDAHTMAAAYAFSPFFSMVRSKMEYRL